MGRAKEQFMEEQERQFVNSEVEDFIKVQLDKEAITTNPLLGIARQITSQGYNSLTDKQKYVVDKHIIYYKDRNKCDRCIDGNMSSLSDYIHVEESTDRLCPMCEYDKEKFMRD